MIHRQSALSVASLVASIVAVIISIVAFTVAAKAQAANPWLNVYCPGGMRPFLYVLGALFVDVTAIAMGVRARKLNGQVLASLGLCLAVPATTISFLWILGYVG